MKSPLRPLKNRKTRKRKKKKWRFQLQLIQGNGPFPYFLERLLVLVLASCLRRWMATVDASDRSMPPYSLDFHLKKKLLFLFMFHNSLRLFNFQKYFVLCIGSVSFPFNAVYGKETLPMHKTKYFWKLNNRRELWNMNRKRSFFFLNENQASREAYSGRLRRQWPSTFAN